MIAMKAPLYGIEVKYVDPRGTTSSREHNEIMKRYGLDRHAASAHLIALRGLRNQ
jgi:transposase